jgi:L-ascorbate metabolism protein UlaG (beta-lactamase superfamily)
MRVSILGHASMYIESGDARVLVDPILHTDPIGGGSSAHYLERDLRLSQMPPPNLLAITHAHHDHLDPPSLAKLDRNVQVVAPRDPDTLRELSDLGFRNIHILDPWESFACRGVRVVATPSDCEVREVGYVFEDSGGRLWDMCDSEADAAIGERVRRDIGRCEVVAAKYQPSAQIMTGIFRSLGPRWDKHRVVDWAEAAVATAPRLVFPYASGVAFVGRYAWLNRYLFPIPSTLMADMFTQRLAGGGVGTTLMPGDVVRLHDGDVSVDEQACPFVRYVPHDGDEPVWEPIQAEHLAGLDTAAEREELTERLLDLLRGPWARWLIGDLDARVAAGQSLLVDLGVVWQLTVHLGQGERLTFSLDLARRPWQLVAGELPHANVFGHVSGRSLLDVLRKDAGSDLLYSTADALTYERIFGVRDGRFWAPELQDFALVDRLPDLLTYYLRWQGPHDGVTAR